MIDLRCHVLEGTGCGPESFDESLEICRAAVEDGVRTLVASVRWYAGAVDPPLPFAECQEKIGRLNEIMNGSLALKTGFVLPFAQNLPELADAYGRKITLAGNRHLLVSFPSLRVPADVEGIWDSLGRRGLSVVVAHPECNPVLRRDQTRLDRWVSRGITLQVDAASLVGAHGREVRKFAVGCLRKYQRSIVVASNARSAVGFSLGKAKEFLTKEFGSRLADFYSSEAPAAILNSIHIDGKPPSEESKRNISPTVRPKRLTIKLGDITTN